MLWWDKRKLGSKDSRARRNAAERLISKKTYAPLIQALSNDSRDVRETAVAALADVDAPKVVEALCALLGGSNAERRREALLVLAKCGPTRFREAHQSLLCEIARNDSDRAAAQAAVELLAPGPCIDDVVLNARDAEVRKSALAKIESAGLRPLIARLDTPFLEQLVRTHPSKDIRLYALENPNCPPDVLAEAARSDPDQEARAAAIRNPNMADRAALEAFAGSENAEIRESAVARLADLDIGHVTDDAELEMMVDAGKDEAIRIAALKKIKGQQTLMRIALTHENAMTRRLAADCLKDDEARLRVAVETSDPQVHRAAGSRIAKDDLRARLVNDLLLRFLSGSKEEIRRAAELIGCHIWEYTTREAIGELGLAIVNRLVPRVNYQDMGPMKGRRDTFEWLVLAFLNDLENPHYGEYLPELKRWASRVPADKVDWAKRAGVPL